MYDEQDHGILGALTNWLAHPFNSEGSVLNWALFIGLLLVIIWFWNWVLIQLAEA
jgi:hypothetical protein